MDILPDDLSAMASPEFPLWIDTDRFGPFQFQLGVDASALALPLQRVQDAHARFVTSPLAHVANRLEREVVASSVFGTNTIEGGTLTEDETAAALDLDPARVQAVEQLRVLNIKAAYDHARSAAQTPGWCLSVDFIRDIHALITHDIPHADNRPGLLRDTPKGRVTQVGNVSHGGIYKPPQFGGDVARLLVGLIDWHAQLARAGVPALIRAPLVHYYYELIHPFWDGNGRVGRVLEATLLQAAGYRYASFAMARHYLAQIDHYFALFNTCRKAEARHEPAPNMAFVAFHLDGMLQTINALHDRVNQLVGVLLYQTRCRQLLDAREINTRQYTIVSQLLATGQAPTPAALRQMPWFQSLYLKLNDKTRSRDWAGLKAQGLIVEEGGVVLPAL